MVLKGNPQGEITAQEKCIHGLLGHKQACLQTPGYPIYLSLGPSIFAGVNGQKSNVHTVLRKRFLMGWYDNFRKFSLGDQNTSLRVKWNLAFLKSTIFIIAFYPSSSLPFHTRLLGSTKEKKTSVIKLLDGFCNHLLYSDDKHGINAKLDEIRWGRQIKLIR